MQMDISSLMETMIALLMFVGVEQRDVEMTVCNPLLANVYEKNVKLQQFQNLLRINVGRVKAELDAG